MAEKWEVYHQTDDNNNPMFCVLSRDGLNARIIGMSFTQKEEAQLLAASPLMLEALEAAREYVINTTTDCRECGEPNSSSSRDKTIDIIDAAIAAAKGE